jgi:murein DD-endopeptidase MepM/ murein hydrolase activator NlpD
MQQHQGVRAVLRILRHDFTLLVLVVGLLVISVGVIAAARRGPSEIAVEPPPPAAVPAQIEAEAAGPGPPRAAVPGRIEAEAAGAAPPPESEPVAEEPPAPRLRITRGELAAGDTLASALGREGVTPDVVHVIARELSPLFNFRRARPGHRYRLVRDAEGALVAFRYQISSIDSYLVRRDGDGWAAAKEEAELRPQVARIAGLVTSSLHGAVVALGERGQLANDFADVFAWDVDFSRSVRPGDEFAILYERLYRSDPDEGEVYVRPGRILAARYKGEVGEYKALYFELEEGRGGYYRPDGRAVERQFLLAPVRYTRISSRFSSARRHPILKITRPHHGIDYVAPAGTPLWSVADGRVLYRGWAGGFGNLIKIRHNNGYVSYYAHLSRFAKGLAVGQPVHQKQVIGYVGKTGLATGAHVCFRIARDGQYVDPRRLQTPAGDPVPPELLASFRVTRDVLLAELDAGPLVAAEEAR